MVLRTIILIGILVKCLAVGTISRRLGVIQKHEIRPLDMPYITLYEHENFRGTFYTQVLGKECYNLPDHRSNWTSSIDTHRRCVDLCTRKNCESGSCRRMEPNTIPQRRLSKIKLNDNIVSLKSCYI